MRISDFEKNTIKRLARNYFGETAAIWLFGSRVDDHQKGGDIDLYLQSQEAFPLLFNKKIDFLIALKKEIGDQKIDLVIHSLSDTSNFQPIYQIAQETGVLL